MNILTAENTAFELEQLKPELAFFPIGATEQHSRHLPLATDTILSDTLSEEILRLLDWPGHVFLLPTLPISSSMENTGYRGTVSFNPMTMRGIIRDTYESLASVGIKRLIVCPWHGGNFILKPVIRELNRELGRCCVFYVNPWERVPQEIYSRFSAGFEVHCGEVETSLMLAVDRQMVRPECADNPLPGGFNPAWQDMWSMKTLSGGQGHCGHPSKATFEKGLMFKDAVIEATGKYIRELLEMAERHKSY